MYIKGKKVTKPKLAIYIILGICTIIWLFYNVKGYFFVGTYYEPSEELYYYHGYKKDITGEMDERYSFIQFIPEKEQLCYIQLSKRFNRTLKKDELFGVATYFSLRTEEYLQLFPGLYINARPKMPLDVFAFDNHAEKILALHLKPLYYISYGVDLNRYTKAPNRITTWSMKDFGFYIEIEDDSYLRVSDKEEKEDYKELMRLLKSYGDRYDYE